MQSPILVVEDSPEDFQTTKWGLEKAGLQNPLVHCQDGDFALDYLYRRGPFTDPHSAPRPSLILLDLNLPGTDGREVLESIKKDENLRTIPVIVLTTSKDPRDVHQCYLAGANSYVQKPVGLDGFVQTMQRLKQWWLEVAVYPADTP